MSPSTPEPASPSRLWIASIWLSLGLLNAAQVVVGMRAVGMQHDWIALFFVNAVSWLVWACATPLVLALNQRFPISRALGWNGFAIHVAVVAAVSVADACWNATLYYFLNPYALTRNLPGWRHLAINALYDRFHVGLISCAAIIAASHAVGSLRRLALREAESARLSAELSKAQLDALRRQLEPHFLFNTLNGIAGLVRENKNGAAVEMIAGLGDLLRRLLQRAERQEVPLAEELSFLDRYVELQQMRFGDRLQVVVNVPPDLYGALVPSLVLQPLVENAIEHGIGQRSEGGVVRIGAVRNGGMLTISVHNDGPVLRSGGAENDSGVGIANTRGRLTRLYGTACVLEVRNHAETGVETIVQVPYRQ